MYVSNLFQNVYVGIEIIAGIPITGVPLASIEQSNDRLIVLGCIRVSFRTKFRYQLFIICLNNGVGFDKYIKTKCPCCEWPINQKSFTHGGRLLFQFKNFIPLPTNYVRFDMDRHSGETQKVVCTYFETNNDNKHLYNHVMQYIT